MNRDELVEYIKQLDDIDAYSYDGSYELFQKTVEAYRGIDLRDTDYHDWNAVYFMVVGTWKQSVSVKHRFIDESHLPEDRKQTLHEVLNTISQNAVEGLYENSDAGSVGMFGTGFNSFRANGTHEGFVKIINLLLWVAEENDDDVCFDYVEDVFNGKIGGIAAGAASMMLHCLKPTMFPIMNSNQGQDDIYKFLGVDIKNRGSLEYYASNCRKIKAFRDDNFAIKNYRVFDIANWKITQENNLVEGKKTDITYGRNILLYGVPGAGKSFTIQRDYCSDQKFIERVVFHPDYTYSDFVGQILPRVEDESLEYVFTPGPFTNILKKAKTDPDNMYFLIIEEINRGNAPAIFGEIFQLLDRKEEGKYPDDKVGESEYGITIFDVAKEVYGDEQHEIIIPRNLTILATMNTADQNVFTLDTAFQRRWEMKQIENNVLGAIHAEDYIEGNDITWGAFATTINELVLESGFGMASSEDKRLGAYFVKRKELQKKKFSEKVLKYLWDDVFKMDREQVFNPDILSMDKMLNIYMKTETNPLAAVIKKDVYVRMQNFDPESFAEPITKTTDNE